jgi:hypothetical protein
MQPVSQGAKHRDGEATEEEGENKTKAEREGKNEIKK